MIIIINGCPSAGKTSLVKEIQSRHTKPLLNMGAKVIFTFIFSYKTRHIADENHHQYNLT